MRIFRRFLLAAVILVAAAAPTLAVAPRVIFTSPTAGQSFDSSTVFITVAGTVTNPGSDTFIQLFLNGAFQQNILLDVSVTPATFSNPLVLVSGQNVIAVSDTNADGTDTGTVTVTSLRPANDIRVNLVWNHPTNDVDLYLFVPRDPDTGKDPYAIWFGNRSPAGQAGSLDVDDVTGLGPENISFPAGSGPPSGQYVLAINLFRHDDASVVLSKVTVILNEGTTSQSTFTFDTVALTTANAGSDVFATGSTTLPSLTNSTSTFFFSFSFVGASRAKFLTVITYPNPFLAGQGNVTFQIGETADPNNTISAVEIYDLFGRKVNALTGAGSSTLAWDGRSATGEPMASGIYYYVLRDRSGRVGRSRFTLVR